mgnify:CR=1 FL=1
MRGEISNPKAIFPLAHRLNYLTIRQSTASFNLESLAEINKVVRLTSAARATAEVSSSFDREFDHAFDLDIPREAREHHPQFAIIKRDHTIAAAFQFGER